MRIFKWDPMFNPEEKTSTIIDWISFPTLPIIFFVNKAMLSLAVTAEKPQQVDLLTQNKMRSNYARVKMEVDLLGELP